MTLADITHAGGNVPLGGQPADVKLLAAAAPPAAPYSCDGKFLPMR
jgi:hypothetical protein